MSAKKDLQKVYQLRKELKMWEEKLREIEHASAVSQKDSNGMKDATGEQATALADTKEIIVGLLAQIRMAERDTVKFVEGIDDPLIRQIVMYRCYDCYSWVKIAIKTGSTEGAVKMMYYRFVKSL